MNVKVMGADYSATNVSGNDYASTLQASTDRSRLYKVSFGPLAGMSADVYAWIFDTAAGDSSSAAPVMVRYIPAGVADTWDFGPDGSLFRNGIFIALSTVAPTNAATTVTDAGSNKVIIKADIRVK